MRRLRKSWRPRRGRLWLVCQFAPRRTANTLIRAPTCPQHLDALRSIMWVFPRQPHPDTVHGGIEWSPRTSTTIVRKSKERKLSNSTTIGPWFETAYANSRVHPEQPFTFEVPEEFRRMVIPPLHVVASCTFSEKAVMMCKLLITINPISKKPIVNSEVSC